MRPIFSKVFCVALILFFQTEASFAESTTAIDEHTLSTGKNLLTEINPLNPDGTMNAVIEIPAGTSEKWEVKKIEENPKGYLMRDFSDGKPRIVSYLPYPVNYGMLPQTVLSKDKGGDGDPVDILVLGPAFKRGEIIITRPIGIIELKDRGEKDDKILAVPLNGIFQDINSIEALNESFPGVTDILQTWFSNYKGQGKMQFLGYLGAQEANRLARESVEDFKALTQTEPN